MQVVAGFATLQKGFLYCRKGLLFCTNVSGGRYITVVKYSLSHTRPENATDWFARND